MSRRRSRSTWLPVAARLLAGALASGLVLGLLPTPVLAVAAPASAPADDRVRYQPPVDAEVVDPFRPPGHRYGPGNRGIDYGTAPGAPVGAAAPGIVAFAGAVGAGLHVTVLHADGLRTTYAFLGSVEVRRGRRVAAGDLVGRARGAFHFGARVGDEYVDPRVLFATDRGRLRARLVPDPGELDVRPRSVAAERRSLARLVRALPRFAGRSTAAGVRAAARVARRVPRIVVTLAAQDERVRLWLLQARRLTPSAWVAVGADVADAIRGRPCTPADRAPPRPSDRRIAVLVAGLNSSSEGTGVDRVDTSALGYARHDVHRFSYRGGTVPSAPYEAVDTTADIAAAGARLAALLARLAEAHPGTPIDVIAYSQGGLVAQAAVTHPPEAEPGRASSSVASPPVPAAVATLVTLGTPHRGADLAAGVLAAPDPRGGAAAATLLAGPDRTGILVDRPNFPQLVPGSPFLRGLAARRLPPQVRAVSVAARYDIVVASHRSRFPGAAHVVVSVPGLLDQHTTLPRSAAAMREIALAVAGLPPTCRSPADTAVDAIVARVIAAAQVKAAAEAVSRATGGGRP